MAKFLSLVYSSIRGKVGGLVYTKNQFAGLVVRAFTAPTNPGTEPQTIIRSAFDESSVKWATMSQADRDGWDDYAATLEYTGPHGTYKLPGRQVFMSNYSLASYMEQRAYGGVSAIDSPPLVAGFLNPGPIFSTSPTTVSSTGIGFSVGNATGESITVFAQRSLGFNPTKNTYKGPWIDAANQGLDVAIDTTAVGEFIGLETGQAYFMKLRAITQESELRISAPFYLRMLAVDIGP